MKLCLHFVSICILIACGRSFAEAQACSFAGPACVEFVPIANETGRISVYRSDDLTTRNERLTHALVVIHGAERDAAFAFDSATDAARLVGQEQNTLVVAPRFAANVGKACTDELAAKELNWNCDVTLSDWRAGGLAINAATIASFDVVDEILRVLHRKELFPNLKTIVVAGHSAGGQFVTNYQMANRVHDRLEIKPLYVAANASAYAYPDDGRPVPSKLEGCGNYADWPFGFAKRTGYAARLSDSVLRRQAIERGATYLVGQFDVGTLNQGGFYAKCEGQAQGMNLQSRGLEFAKHMKEQHGAAHQAVIVKNCGHSERCMFTSLEARPFLFPQ